MKYINEEQLPLNVLSIVKKMISQLPGASIMNSALSIHSEYIFQENKP